METTSLQDLCDVLVWNLTHFVSFLKELFKWILLKSEIPTCSFYNHISLQEENIIFLIKLRFSKA